MRIGFVIAILIACSAPQVVEGGPAETKPSVPATKEASGGKTAGASKPPGGAREARAANARGLALHKQKKYAAAEAEYRKAIELDPGYVLAHYNLACAATLADDLETAIVELAWLGNRAAWDDQARAAVMKETKDPDLKGLEGVENVADWVPPNVLMVKDVLAFSSGGAGSFGGHLLTDAERAKLAAPLAAAPGPHAAECDPADVRQGRVFGLPLISGRVANHTAVASLRDGVALLDPAGKLVARSEPIGCTAPGASQDQLGSLVYLDGALDWPTARPRPIPDAFYLVEYSAGGRAQWTTNVALFARRDQQLVRVLDAILTSSDAAGAGRLVQTLLGDLIYLAPGEKQKRVLHWDPTAFKFAPLP
jgi:hypothetical protein